MDFKGGRFTSREHEPLSQPFASFSLALANQNCVHANDNDNDATSSKPVEHVTWTTSMKQPRLTVYPECYTPPIEVAQYRTPIPLHENIMLELHVWGPAFGLPSIDAHCLAAIAYLQQAVPRGKWQLIATSDPALSPTSTWSLLPNQ
jgi:hypothetical protein